MQVEFDALDPDDLRALFAGAMSDNWDTSAFERVVQWERADRQRLSALADGLRDTKDDNR